MIKLAAPIAASLSISAVPALADEHQTSEAPAAKQTIMPSSERGRTMFEEFGFSEAVIHDGTVYLSGVIVGPPREGQTEAEVYDRAFEYLGFVLERAGSSWDDALDITTFHVDIEQSMPALSAAKDKVIKAPFPAWTAIDIDRLFAEDGLVEIKIVARVTPVAEEGS
ncbi:Rid family hydrolase [uncultured Erythrobacter sp.]|uniref:Rid family hydrolase n=1 Tax=uncultured Erythrobacter sp. TaxID=263913 RepID=UPI00260E1870|nr:Rid family hydrolase [uncultured Erythrobacter sp.]